MGWVGWVYVWGGAGWGGGEFNVCEWEKVVSWVFFFFFFCF